MTWREKGKSRIRAVKMGNLRGLVDIKRIDRMMNAQVTELCGLKKRVNDESVFLKYAKERV